MNEPSPGTVDPVTPAPEVHNDGGPEESLNDASEVELDLAKFDGPSSGDGVTAESTPTNAAKTAGSSRWAGRLRTRREPPGRYSPTRQGILATLSAVQPEEGSLVTLSCDDPKPAGTNKETTSVRAAGSPNRGKQSRATCDSRGNCSIPDSYFWFLVHAQLIYSYT